MEYLKSKINQQTLIKVSITPNQLIKFPTLHFQTKIFHLNVHMDTYFHKNGDLAEQLNVSFKLLDQCFKSLIQIAH
ncbi:unnamed protein product [Paramecium primaurelia]|uniref:Uncharacterized protein n=1 Tax=Paramecium primaurelia TaxID=5886 RepID=A0A8S1MM74_PARPR|nr:unnamed protein product [Paramecium primaurelia]